MARRPVPKAPTAWGKQKLEPRDMATDEPIKEVDGDSGSRPADLKKFLSYYPESTAFHGIPKIYGARGWPLRLLWTALFLSASGVMVSQLIKLFSTYYTWPVKTTVTLGYGSLAFPAVSLCNVNPIKLSHVRLAPCDLQNVLPVADDYKSQQCVAEAQRSSSSNQTESDYYYYHTTEECYYDDAGQEVCEAFSPQLLDKGYLERQAISKIITDTSRDIRYEIGHKIEDMLMECSINGRKCYAENFTNFLSNEFGNCYTFQTKGLVTRESGLESGLHLTLNLELEEFLDSYKSGYGLRLIVHENGVRPFPTSEGITVSSGSEVAIGLRQVKMQRMGGKYGKCIPDDVFKQKYDIKYTVEACRSLCLRDLVREECGCLHADDFDIITTDHSMESCFENKDMECNAAMEKKFTNSREEQLEKCDCASPCKETSYQQSISARKWPTFSRVNELETQVCENNPNSSKCFLMDLTFEGYEKRSLSFVRLTVYFQTLNFESIQEEPFYNLERFLSDIGGTMGLWIGASLLSLAEVFELFLETMVFFFRRMCS